MDLIVIDFIKGIVQIIDFRCKHKILQVVYVVCIK